jgi:hypothetical protein
MRNKDILVSRLFISETVNALFGKSRDDATRDFPVDFLLNTPHSQDDNYSDNASQE